MTDRVVRGSMWVHGGCRSPGACQLSRDVLACSVDVVELGLEVGLTTLGSRQVKERSLKGEVGGSSRPTGFEYSTGLANFHYLFSAFPKSEGPLPYSPSPDSSGSLETGEQES